MKYNQSNHIAIAVLLSPAILIGCRHDTPESRRIDESDRPSFLFITLDTTRADRIGCYGYKDADTPMIDSIAKSGIRFEQAFCQVPLTLPSHASMFTATYPATNGVRVNGVAALGEGIPTLAENFQRRGYHTGAFVAAAVMDRAFGLARGFDHYDDQMPPSASAFGHGERRGDEVCEAAIRWLGSKGEPFFAWIHFFDPHDPYAPPEPFRSRLSDPYDGEIAFVDAQIRRILEWLDSRGLRQRTAIVIAGDHGEAFEEHGEVRHGLFIYESTMRVPLILSFPDRLPQGIVVDGVVRMVDVFPTLIELLNWDPVPGIEGVSLLPACLSDKSPVLPAYGESEYARVAYGWAPLRSLTTAQWKYIDAPAPELYDRIADPGEMNNVVSHNANIASQLHDRLQLMVKQMKPRSAAPVTLSATMRAQLESLGYVGTSASSQTNPENRSLKDPKDMIDAYRRHMKAAAALQESKFGEVVALMKPLVKRSPESGEFLATIGQAYLGLERGADAQIAFEASLRQTPDHADRLCGLGDALNLQGKTDDALEVYQLAVTAEPDSVAVHGRLGSWYAARRQFESAHTHFRRACELNPDSANTWSNLGNVQMALNQPEAAAKSLRQALAVDKNNAPAHRALWRTCLAQGQTAETVHALRAAVTALPDDVGLALRLSWMLATTTRDDLRSPREALSLARQIYDNSKATPNTLDVLAAAQAATGDYPAAVATAHHALELAEAEENLGLARRIEVRIRLYESRQPFRQ